VRLPRSVCTAALIVSGTPDELFNVFGSARSERIVATTETGWEVVPTARSWMSQIAEAEGAKVPSSHFCCPLTFVRLHVADPNCTCGGNAKTTTVFGAARDPALAAFTCTVVD
jgi:hypothetical protein